MSKKNCSIKTKTIEYHSGNQYTIINYEGIGIGNYYLMRTNYDKVWIQDLGGEGGEFDEKKLEKVIEQFYKKNF